MRTNGNPTVRDCWQERHNRSDGSPVTWSILDLRATSGLFSYRFNCRQFFEALLEKVIQECADGSNLFLPLVSGIGKVRLKITFVLND